MKKGNRSQMKTWCILVSVLVLALSLTSCGKKKKETLQAQYGVALCDGTMGSFDVYVMETKGRPGFYDIILVLVQADQPGDIVSITLADSASGVYKQLQSQIVLGDAGDEIEAGSISEAELEKYDTVAITPFDPTTNFASQVSQKDAICDLPLLGDGVEE